MDMNLANVILRDLFKDIFKKSDSAFSFTYNVIFQLKYFFLRYRKQILGEAEK